MRAALIQLCCGDDPDANLIETSEFIREAAGGGAKFVLTPEVTNCVSRSRKHQHEVLSRQAEDITLAALRELTAELDIWLLIGSLALKSGDADGRFVNRSFMVSPTGGVVAQYDKIHMFDVTISGAETFAESSAYRPGDRAVLAETGLGRVGMTICYDVRFVQLYRALAKAGAQVLTVPAAFSPVSGAAHWQVLLRARAIETGCFVLAPAQSGQHATSRGKTRTTWGHSLAISPWGEVLADAGEAVGVTMVDLKLMDVDAARARIGALNHDRPFKGP